MSSSSHQPQDLAHHFHTKAQQVASSKLGMWIFLAQELLFFSGLFVAYAAVRYFYPDTMLSAREHLSIPLGTFGTLVLLTSSLTMVLAVRAAQVNEIKQLKQMLLLTILLGLVFIGVKYIEYDNKFAKGFYPGNHFNGVGLLDTDQKRNVLQTFRLKAGSEREKVYFRFSVNYPATEDALAASLAAAKIPALLVERAPKTLAVTAPQVVAWDAYNKGDRDIKGWGQTAGQNTFAVTFKGKPHVFFGLYFAMTALHGLHVLLGVLVLLWLWRRARRAEFSPAYYAPVENVGLYWQLVALIWIFLFPLLYLVK